MNPTKFKRMTGLDPDEFVSIDAFDYVFNRRIRIYYYTEVAKIKASALLRIKDGVERSDRQIERDVWIEMLLIDFFVYTLGCSFDPKAHQGLISPNGTKIYLRHYTTEEIGNDLIEHGDYPAVDCWVKKYTKNGGIIDARYVILYGRYRSDEDIDTLIFDQVYDLDEYLLLQNGEVIHPTEKFPYSTTPTPTPTTPTP